MKQGRELGVLWDEINRQHGLKHDFLPYATDITFQAKNPETQICAIKGKGEFGPTQLFQNQLSEALGIPLKYYQRMLLEDPGLLETNVNTWLQRSEKQYMVRTLDGRARAFLSNRYNRIDHLQVMDTVLPELEGIPDVKIASCEVTENKLYLKILNPRLKGEIKVDDVVESGIVISNSEVGMGSVSVTPLLYRLVCKNGMIANNLAARKYHIGSAQNDLDMFFSDETKKADDKAFLMRIRDLIRAMCDRAQFEKLLSQLKTATAQPIEGNIHEVVELTAKETSLTKEEGQAVLSHLIRSDDYTKYGLANAITRTSQDVKGYERATELENIGWSVATFSHNTWTRLNAPTTESRLF